MTPPREVSHGRDYPGNDYRGPGYYSHRALLLEIIEGVNTTKTADKPARADKHWTPDEIQYLAEHYGLVSDKTLASRLQRAVGAIIQYASRKRVVSRQTNFYTTSLLARLLGIPCRKQVLGWVKRGWLKGRQSAMSQGKHGMWRFSERSIVQCLKQRPWLANLRRMEEHYFGSVVIKEWERDPWYTVKQAVPLFGFTNRKAVYSYIHRGWLPAEKKPCQATHEGAWIIRRSAIEALERLPEPRQKATRDRRIKTGGELCRLKTFHWN